MCTVTFVPLTQNDFILTSSRDVLFTRKPSQAPKNYVEDGVTLHYPMDNQAGGTWIGTSSHSRLICLLNGGFKNHEPSKQYRVSRGLIVKDILKGNDFFSTLNDIILDDIEPFTIVALDWSAKLILVELVWDGAQKHMKQLPLEPKIWSSSTLYSTEVKKWRELWFNEWQKQQQLTENTLLDFHKNAGIGDPEIDVMMTRDKGGTMSITQVVKRGSKVQMAYEAIQRTTA